MSHSERKRHSGISAHRFELPSSCTCLSIEGKKNRSTGRQKFVRLKANGVMLLKYLYESYGSGYKLAVVLKTLQAVWCNKRTRISQQPYGKNEVKTNRIRTNFCRYLRQSWAKLLATTDSYHEWSKVLFLMCLHNTEMDLKEIGSEGGYEKCHEDFSKARRWPSRSSRRISAMYRPAALGASASDIVFVLVLLIITPCSLVGGYWLFSGTYCADAPSVVSPPCRRHV